MLVKDLIQLFFNNKNENVKNFTSIENKQGVVFYNYRMENLFNALEDLSDLDYNSMFTSLYPILEMEISYLELNNHNGERMEDITIYVNDKEVY